MNTYCIEADCENIAYLKGSQLCPTHYEQDRKGHAAQTRDHTNHPECDVPGCRVDATSRKDGAFCREHYQVWYRGEDPYTWSPPAAPKAQECWYAPCNKRATTKSLCHYHYKRARMGKLDVPESLGVVLNDPCTFEGCTKITEAKGLCHTHLIQKKAGQELKPLREWGKYVKGKTFCRVGGCQGAEFSKGLCRKHSRGFKYGMTTEEIVVLFENSECANPGCSNNTNLHIDHCHETGKVRALLCSGCNASLGFLKEQPARMRGLAEYIERF